MEASPYYTQAGDLYRIMSEAQKSQLAANIAGGLSEAESSVRERMLGFLAKADPDYRDRVREAMERMSRVAATDRAPALA